LGGQGGPHSKISDRNFEMTENHNVRDERVFQQCVGVRPFVAEALATADGARGAQGALQESQAVATRTGAMKASDLMVEAFVDDSLARR
jgi:hypothetical protein